MKLIEIRTYRLKPGCAERFVVTVREAPPLVALETVGVGEDFTVRRITEELEFEPGMLDFLEGSSITPGSNGVLTARSPDGTATVEIDGNTVGVGGFASARILVSTHS